MIVDHFGHANHLFSTRSEISPETLADMFTATIEGGIMLARNFDDNRLLVDQIMAYRTVLRILYGTS